MPCNWRLEVRSYQVDRFKRREEKERGERKRREAVVRWGEERGTTHQEGLSGGYQGGCSRGGGGGSERRNLPLDDRTGELVYRKFLLHNFMKNIKTHCICLLFKPQGYLDSSNAVFQYGCMSSYAGHCCSCPWGRWRSWGRCLWVGLAGRSQLRISLSSSLKSILAGSSQYWDK